jgi:hypothetical protein
MSEENKKRRTDKEIMLLAANGSTDDLTADELSRYSILLELEHKKLEKVDLQDRVHERQNKRDMKFMEFKSRGQSIQQSEKVDKQRQESCSHMKGGRGVEALQGKGTDASDYAVIRHLMPDNAWWQRCQRCGKTWKMPNKLDFAMDTPQGQAAYAEALVEYKTALKWPTNNTASTGITFKHESEDNNVTAAKFLHDAYKDVNLR